MYPILLYYRLGFLFIIVEHNIISNFLQRHAGWCMVPIYWISQDAETSHSLQMRRGTKDRRRTCYFMGNKKVPFTPEGHWILVLATMRLSRRGPDSKQPLVLISYKLLAANQAQRIPNTRHSTGLCVYWVVASLRSTLWGKPDFFTTCIRSPWRFPR